MSVKEDGTFRLDQKYFNYATGLTMINENFSKLFFSDRNSCNFSCKYEELISYTNTHDLDYKKGDIIFSHYKGTIK